MSTTQNKTNKSNYVLGINQRNAIYIRPYNRRRAKEIADDKLLSKKILTRHGIPMSEVYKVIRNNKQLNTLKWDELPKSFALKPNVGTGGSGIIVFYGRKTHTPEWIKPDGSSMTIPQIHNHISNILEGQFSMGNRRDIAIIEERIINHPLLKKYSYKGVPDIRIIVFNKVPIMAELRLPTFQSEGKANLHAGGIGVGIDIGSGITTTAILRKGSSLISDTYNIIETTVDDKKLQLSGIQIPYWKEILKISIKCQESSGLGFLGADIALDKNKGPIVFELNARSGLAIQTANVGGMRRRLERVKGLNIKDANHGIRVAQNLFGGEIENEVRDLSGKQIIGLIEKVTFYPPIPSDKNNTQKDNRRTKSKFKPIRTKARINTGDSISRISSRLASRLGYKSAIDHVTSLEIPSSFESRAAARKYLKENQDRFGTHEQITNYTVTSEKDSIIIRPVLSVKLELGGHTTSSDMIVNMRKDLEYSATIARRDLKGYLIDTSKTFLLH